MEDEEIIEKADTKRREKKKIKRKRKKKFEGFMD